MTDKPKMSVAALKALPVDAKLWCHVVKGLHAHRRAGATSWVVTYLPHSGKRRWLRLGDYPTLTIELARDAAREILTRVAKGDDPAADRHELRQSPTVDDLWAEWLKRKAPGKKARSNKEDAYNYANHIGPRIGKSRVRDITSTKVAEEIARLEAGWLEPCENGAEIRRGGATAARNVRTLLSGLFRLAEHGELKWREPNTNPVRDVPAPRSGKRRTHITREQFAKLDEALEAQRSQWPWHVGCIWVALYCGTRITELATAKKVALIGSAIHLDEHKTDATGDARVIRLSPPALEELAKLPGGASPYLFGPLGAMNDGGKDSARRSVHYVFDQVRQAAGIPDVRPQDLRRTFASVATNNGASLTQTGQLFGHKSPSTTDRYAWLFDTKAQELASSVGSAIKSYAGGKTRSGLRFTRIRKV